jgi:hypothetical protein
MRDFNLAYVYFNSWVGDIGKTLDPLQNRGVFSASATPTRFFCRHCVVRVDTK